MKAKITRSNFAFTLLTLGVAFVPLLFGPRFSGLPLSWLLAFLFLAVGAILDRSASGETSRGGLVGFVFLLCASIAIAFANGLNLGATTSNTQEWVLITIPFLILTAVVQARVRDPLNVLRTGLIISALLIMLFRSGALLQMPTLDLGSAQQPVLTEYYLQSAYIVALGAISAFHAATDPDLQRKKWRPVIWVLFLVYVGIVLSFASRTAILMIGIGVGVIVLGGIIRSKRGRSRVVFALPVAGLALYFLYTSSAGEILRQRFNDSSTLDSNAERRARIQELSVQVAREHPLGIGWDSFATFSSSSLSESIRSTHSLYTGLMLSIGIAGLLAILYIALRNLISGWTARTFTALLPAALSATMLTAGIADDITVYPIGLSYLVLLLSLGFIIVQRKQ